MTASSHSCHLAMSFDMRAPAFGASPTVLYAAAVEQAAWADDVGFNVVSVSEHHGAEDGYLPSPIVLASAIAARTSRVAVRISALVVPLHNPLRVAEDLAVLDNISNGRLVIVIGAGYREEEFDMFGVDLADRGRLVERGVEVLTKAWTGQPFEYDGRTVRITPRPVQRPRPPLLLGGGTKISAKRAARIADGYRPAKPGLMEIYLAELEALGREHPTVRLETGGQPFVHVSEDPERDWARIAPHALHETNSYAAWAGARSDLTPFRAAADRDALRQSGRYLVLTPDECVELFRSRRAVNMRPLMGGMDPELGWESLYRLASDVLPRL